MGIERKEELTTMRAMSEKAFKEISDNQGIDVAKLLHGLQRMSLAYSAAPLQMVQRSTMFRAA